MNFKLKDLLMLVTLVCVNFSFSQQLIQGKVINENNESISGAFIQNLTTNSTTISNNNGLFQLNINVNDTIIVKALSYFTKMYIVEKIDSTKTLEFRLKQNTEILNTIEVSGNKVKTVIDKTNETLLDFVFWEDYLVYLSKENNNYYIGLSNKINTLSKVKLNIKKPIHLYVDTQSNIYIANKDSTYQFYLDAAFTIIDRMSNIDYTTIIEPIKCINESFIISEKVTNHNKNYNLIVYNGTLNKSKIIYTSFDEIAAKTAKSKYYEIISYYNRNTVTTANIITNKFWSGDIKELGHIDPVISQMIVWYDNILSKPLNVVTIKNKDEIVVFDFYKSIIKKYSSNGTVLSSLTLQKTSSNFTDVLFDKKTNRFYLIYPYNNKFLVDYIDTTTGEIKNLFSYESTLPKSIKINDGWIYFLSSKNNFYKLYKIQMK